MTNLPSQLDNSKLDCFERCPRKFWFQYMNHWTGERENVNLVWGEALHHALAVGYANGWTPDAMERGISEAQAIYGKAFSRYEDDGNSPKDSAGLRTTVGEYHRRYESELHDPQIETLAVEVRFRMMVGPVEVCGRMDVVQWDHVSNEVNIIDHKSAGRMPSAAQMSPWHINTQAMMYYTALRKAIRKFGWDTKPGTFTINMLIPKKVGVDFLRIPVMPSADQLYMWEHELIREALQIQEECELTDQLQASNGLMLSFPRRKQSCSEYNSLCPFFTICSTTPNPKRLMEELAGQAPVGMRIKPWNPISVPEEDALLSQMWDLT